MTTRIRISKEAPLPNPVKLARYAKSPELGPAVLFFSGGTALRELSRTLIRYTYNSIHLITPFDSGGSSAELRRAFHMPAIGDVRNRLMALADQSLRGNPEIVALFAHRLPKDQHQDDLRAELLRMARGRHALVGRIPDPMRKIVRNHLYQFLERMPEDFDLRGASIGNLVLTAGYLDNRRLLDPVIYIFSKLVQARGVVRPVINSFLHLVAELEDGTRVLGQHNLTGKETGPIASPVARIHLTADLDDPQPVEPVIRKKIAAQIAEAELVCYPMGSFYSSVVANLLPRGVGRAVAENPCPKVFVPNPDADPEAPGMGVAERTAVLLDALRADDPDAIRPRDVLQFVLVDEKRGAYPGGLDKDAVAALGVEVVHCPLVSDESAPYFDPELLAPVLLSLT